MAQLVTSVAPSIQHAIPQRAWVIVELGWEHNDEFTYAEGETPLTQLFFDKGLADAECERLCAEFFAAETPSDFEVDFAAYLNEGDHQDFDELGITWETLRERDFPDPYYVLELGANELRGAP